MVTDGTTRMKVLLSPAWEHNFPYGPGRWLKSDPNSTSANDQKITNDNYYPTGGDVAVLFERAANEKKEPWWPDNASELDGLIDPAAVYCWDADGRAVTNWMFAGGDDYGNTSVNLQYKSFSSTGAVEAEETTNRFRGTGNPMAFFNMSDRAYVSPTTFLETENSLHFDAWAPFPCHFQDAVHDAILQGSDPSDTTPANKLIFPNKPGTSSGTFGGRGFGKYQSTKGHQFSSHWVRHPDAAGVSPQTYYDNYTGSGRSVGQPEPYTYGYEFTLNIDQITHTWSTLTNIMPLPGASAAEGSDIAQLVSLAIDIGAMREQITVKGKLYDGPNDPYASANEKTIRKQQLLDIVRGQWGAMAAPEVTGNSSGSPFSPNKLPALTIGPMHTTNPNGDQGHTFTVRPRDEETQTRFPPERGGIYTNTDEVEFSLKSLDMWRYGEEPSDDIRGTPLFIEDTGSPYVSEVWSYQFNYQGRRRYRGIITRLSLTLAGGSPDVWDFEFDFAVAKNETAYRRDAGEFSTSVPKAEE